MLLYSSAIYLSDKVCDLPFALNMILATLVLIVFILAHMMHAFGWIFSSIMRPLQYCWNLSSFSIVLVKPEGISYQLLYLEQAVHFDVLIGSSGL